MSWLNNMKTGKKVLLLAGILSVAIGVVGYMGIRGMNTLNAVTTSLYNQETLGISHVKGAKIDLTDMGCAMRQMILDTDQAEMKAEDRNIDTFAKRFQEQLAKCKEAKASDAKLVADIDNVEKEFDQYLAAVKEVGKLTLASQNKEACEALKTKAAPKAQRMDDAMAAIAEACEKAGQEASEGAAQTAASNRNLLIALVAAVALAGLGFGWFLARMIGKMLAALIGETERLSEATVEGKLQTRGNPDLVSLEFRPILEGANKLIDAFVGPINVTAEYVDRISKGDIPPKITDTYQGDFNEIKNNLNACIDVMSGLLRETNALIQATQDGKLQTRGNAQQFAGGWGELVGGVNKLIDAFVAPINVTAEYVDRISKGDIPPKITDTYNGDFNEIKNNLNACIDVMNGLLRETNDPDPGDPGRQAPDARQRAAVRRRLGRAGGRREQADRRLRGPDQRDRRVRGPDLQGRHPAEDHRHLQRRLQRDQEQPQPVHRRGQRPDRPRASPWRRPLPKASWTPGPTTAGSRASTARSSRA